MENLSSQFRGTEAKGQWWRWQSQFPPSVCSRRFTFARFHEKIVTRVIVILKFQSSKRAKFQKLWLIQNYTSQSVSKPILKKYNMLLLLIWLVQKYSYLSCKQHFDVLCSENWPISQGITLLCRASIGSLSLSYSKFELVLLDSINIDFFYRGIQIQIFTHY